MSLLCNRIKRIETKFINMLNGLDSFELITWVYIENKGKKYPVCLWFNSQDEDKFKHKVKVRLYVEENNMYKELREYSSIDEFKNKRKDLLL